MMKRGRRRVIQCRKLQREQFDLAGRHVWINSALRSWPDSTLDREHEFTANALCLREHLWLVGIEDNLKQAFAIAQIDEYHASVVTATVHPTRDSDVLADQ
jgi:hypothetical protein